ncbi:protein of unknown function [Taphrina deformans PYCC 5710]|uniref:Uncharacterized protein n=1 Tax=Taphrina deformans (strain PYCC 5710 / ATCC 11124 / CBS 356.35 / IMI 108563 / JCM 9778 / NBRC 8474) TaxID=1097556 RepID=R4XCE5_TAPDE|nr:protein of unknown function [Taphrina deformans PYCC 5710]|eukprot:CCG83261.1 protein of unknown function [Taphrina deformans PYCC 5710]
MAVGHERQRELKKAKSGTKAGSVPGQNKAEADALRISISAKSSDSELDSVKVSEMLDSTTGGLAEVQQCVKSAVKASTSPAKTKDSEEGKVAEAETQTDTMTKSARKRAVKNKKKQLIGDPATKQESTQSAPPAPDTLDWSEQPMNDNSNRTLLSQTQNAGITTNEKVRTVKSKFSKEEKAEYRAKKAEAARLLKQSIEKPESTETATHAAQLDESSQVTVNPDLSTKRKKDKAQQKNKKSLLSISNECSPALNPSNTAELKVDVPNNHTNSLQTDSEVSEPPTTETIMKPISTSNRPIANNKHRSQKSMDCGFSSPCNN